MGKSYSDKVKNRSSKQKARKNNYDRPKRKDRSVEKPPFPFAPVIVIGIVLILITVSVMMYTQKSDSNDNDNIIINNDDDNNGNDDTPTGSGTGSIILDTTDGRQVFLDQYKGKVVVLDLFATWCGPCKTQMEELDILKTKFYSSEMVILSVGVDLSESMGLLTEFKKDEGATWTFARSNSEFNSVFPSSSIPTLYILDKDGNMGKTHVGVTSASILEDDVRYFL